MRGAAARRRGRMRSCSEAGPAGGRGGGLFSGTVASVTPSADAVTLREHASFVELPDGNYKPRAEDPRDGSRRHAVRRLQRTDRRADGHTKHPSSSSREEGSNAAMSEAVKPIQYWVDPGAPPM